MSRFDWLLVAVTLIIIALAFFGVSGRRADGAELDLPLLRDVICEYETRHLWAYPQKRVWAVSPKQAVGWCQILPTTALDLGCEMSALFTKVGSFDCALKMLTQCGGSVFSRAYCYNPARWYARTIAIKYAEHIRSNAWAPYQLAAEGP